MTPIRMATLGLALAAAAAGARPWNEDVIYFALTDRFKDGDPTNNVPAGSDPSLYDPTQHDINRYQGGDLRGIEQALRDGYFNDLGVTALWLTPPVRNVWRSSYDLGGAKTGYHGYWAQDWLDIDPHLASRASVDGASYADSAEGRLAHYRDVVKLAHARGLKIIQDVVLNHAGPVFFYDANTNGVFDRSDAAEWIRPYKAGGFHARAAWGNIPEWNLRRAQPDGPRDLLGAHVATAGLLARLDTYGRKGFSPDSLGKSDGEEIQCDFFALRDVWTAPDSAHFDALVNEFVEIYAFYLTTIGVDGLRIDTVKHVHREFWDAFTERLRRRLGPAAKDKLLFGEIYDGDPAKLSRFTWRVDPSRHQGPALDSVLDFTFCFAARTYLRHPAGSFGAPRDLEQALLAREAKGMDGRPLYNPTPGPDGLNARQKIVTFIENHDGLNRFRAQGITERRHRLAQALVLTVPGIPCLYYGAECALPDEKGRLDRDGETGRLTLFRNDGGPDFATARSSVAFRDIARLAAMRKKLPVLQTGAFIPLWVDSGAGKEDDGVFAFARASADGEPFAVVVVNASDADAVTAAGSYALSLPARLRTAGRQLEAALVIGPDAPPAVAPCAAGGPLRLAAPAQSVVIYRPTP